MNWLWLLADILLIVVVAPALVFFLNKVYRPIVEIRAYAHDILEHGVNLTNTLDSVPKLVRTRELTFFSLWPDVRSLLLFNGLASHVAAVRWVIHGHHDTWTGIFGAAGRSELSRGSSEPHWLAEFDARIPAQGCPGKDGVDRG